MGRFPDSHGLPAIPVTGLLFVTSSTAPEAPNNLPLGLLSGRLPGLTLSYPELQLILSLSTVLQRGRRQRTGRTDGRTDGEQEAADGDRGLGHSC